MKRRELIAVFGTTAAAVVTNIFDALYELTRRG